MTSKTKQIIMAAIGAYLVYTGISLVQDTIVGEPKNQILFILVGVFFALSLQILILRKFMNIIFILMSYC